MLISREKTEYVKKNTPVLSLIQTLLPSLEIKKKGKNYFSHCPFHNEKTASFCISSEKNIAVCMGCKVGGDVITILQITKKIDFLTAFSILAKPLNVEVPILQIKNNTFLNVFKEVMNYYRFVLKYDKKGLSHLLDSRKLTLDTVLRFKLGLAPSKSVLYDLFIVQEKMNILDFLKTGLIYKKNNVYHDFFTNCFVFPVFNAKQEIITLFGYNPTNKKTKYCFLPNTTKKFLYGFYPSKKKLVLTEGAFDVMQAYQQGIPALGLLSCGLTKQQLQIIIKNYNNVYVCLDGDRAGRIGAYNCMYQLLIHNIKAIEVRLPNGFDLDLFLKENPKTKLNDYLVKM
ncbi:DnaG primase [Candidatus Phytoplasma solani]